MKTLTAPTLAEQHAHAQQTAAELRLQLETAEADQREAVENQDFERAAEAKGRADEVREPLLISQAHATALAAGLAALEEHRRAEQQATRDREQREQAAGLYDEARAREAASQDDVQRLMAEVSAALDAVRQVMREALAAEQSLTQARQDGHSAAVAAGLIDLQHPAPAPASNVRNRFEGDQLLRAILHNQQLL
ncbi:hypothetical protein [Streptomyces sp. PH10-H1]|uniref:hypothetical protein n=1 Tax=Streptomyces sp. PH10-H1 TaxID=3046212 RepID=UPI0024B9D6DF|nr:hypothetical protein [Streptomyces sp. PH10-H1]MDJ0341788.1 hypothetical protein [Streptomyces sp. PH10-H1]